MLGRSIYAQFKNALILRILSLAIIPLSEPLMPFGFGEYR
jgi:hypothetical protein